MLEATKTYLKADRNPGPGLCRESSINTELSRAFRCPQKEGSEASVLDWRVLTGWCLMDSVWWMVITVLDLVMEGFRAAGYPISHLFFSCNQVYGGPLSSRLEIFLPSSHIWTSSTSFFTALFTFWLLNIPAVSIITQKHPEVSKSISTISRPEKEKA